MYLLNLVGSWAMKSRFPKMKRFMDNPVEAQKEVFDFLIENGKNTKYGSEHSFSNIQSEKEFSQNIPIVDYETIFPYIESIMQGEEDVLWPGKVKMFAKSSGTTNARSKFIPVPEENLHDCHYRGGKDLLTLYFNMFPESKLFRGKGVSIGGSLSQIPEYPNILVGDVSALIMNYLPQWAQIYRTPPLEVSLMSEWEDKIQKMAEITMNQDVTSLQGVPTWTVLLLQRILELTGKKNMMEVWPNFEVFAHGAVSFSPYVDVFKEFFPSEKAKFIEIYNATEGFFAIQDQPDVKDMLLLLDNCVYYEFIETDKIFESNPTSYSIGEVELNKNYAMIISTNSGLWRYLIGDTVKFTSLYPHRIKITGRTKQFINAFGEEVIVENAENALNYACTETGARIKEYTAGPIYLDNSTKGGHEWLIEFEQDPSDLALFTTLFDKKLREINSDYDAKRYQDLALLSPKIEALPEGTFYNWMKHRGKLGGQHKVPRLSNDRLFLDEIHDLLKKQNLT